MALQLIYSKSVSLQMNFLPVLNYIHKKTNYKNQIKIYQEKEIKIIEKIVPFLPSVNQKDWDRKIFIAKNLLLEYLSKIEKSLWLNF